MVKALEGLEALEALVEEVVGVGVLVVVAVDQEAVVEVVGVVVVVAREDPEALVASNAKRTGYRNY